MVDVSLFQRWLCYQFYHLPLHLLMVLILVALAEDQWSLPDHHQGLHLLKHQQE